MAHTEQERDGIAFQLSVPLPLSGWIESRDADPDATAAYSDRKKLQERELMEVRDEKKCQVSSRSEAKAGYFKSTTNPQTHRGK